jgi:hypothetical protein
MTARCSICGDAAKRDLVDNALLAGEKPADLLKRYPNVASSSALYRHARAHRPSNILAVQWLDGETTTGELLSDLAGLRRNLFSQYADQRTAGDHSASTRTAHEAHAVSATLLKSGVTDDDALWALRYAERIMRAIQMAARHRPGHARELAEAAARLHDDELEEDANSLAIGAATYSNTLEKEN